MFFYRQTSRMTGSVSAINGSPLMIFLQNVFDSFLMFNWDAGEIWVNAIPHKPLLDVISATFFIVGSISVFIRYLKGKNWIDLFLLLSIPILMLPSTLSIAFPAENPAPNRAGGAMIIVFYFAAIGFYMLITSIQKTLKKNKQIWAVGITIILITIVLISNYNLMFIEHNSMYKQNAWNSSEMGQVLSDHLHQGVFAGDVHVVAYPHWVDGRLVGFNAGLPGLDLSLSAGLLPEFAHNQRQQVFLVKPNHQEAINLLQG